MAAPLPVFTGCGPCPKGFVCPLEITCPVAHAVPASDVFGYLLMMLWIIFFAATYIDVVGRDRARKANKEGSQ